MAGQCRGASRHASSHGNCNNNPGTISVSNRYPRTYSDRHSQLNVDEYFNRSNLINAISDINTNTNKHTDIDSNMDEVEAQLGMVSALAAEVRAPVIVSGVVNTVDDIARAKYIPNIAGLIIGRALFKKDVDLVEALEVAQPRPEPVAEFQ